MCEKNNSTLLLTRNMQIKAIHLSARMADRNTHTGEAEKQLGF